MKADLKKAAMAVVMMVCALGAAAQSYIYTTSFENYTDTVGWRFENGNYANKWFIGTAEHSDGIASLYVSGDSGATANYVYTGNPEVVYAYYEFTMSTASYCDVSFSWKCEGDLTADYFRAFIVPSTTGFTAGRLPNGIPYNSFYNAQVQGWIDVSGGSCCQQPSWRRSIESVHLTAGTWRLVFAWCNDAATCRPPSACIDSIVIEQSLCPMPYGLVVSDVTDDSCILSWHERGTNGQWVIEYADHPFTPQTGQGQSITVNDSVYTLGGLQTQTQYYVYVYSDCVSLSNCICDSFYTRCTALHVYDLPFVDRFDSYATGQADIDTHCWDFYYRDRAGRIRRGGDVRVDNSVSLSPGNSLYFDIRTTAESYAVMPLLQLPADTLQISFSMYNDINAGITVVAMSDPESYSNYILVATVESDTSFVWKNYKMSLVNVPSYCRYVALTNMQTGGIYNGPYYTHIDNVQLKIRSHCIDPQTLVLVGVASSDSTTVEWHGNDPSVSAWDVVIVPAGQDPDSCNCAVTVYDSTYTFTGLMGGTNYDIYVRSNCGNDIPDWVGPLGVQTNKYSMHTQGVDTLDICGVVMTDNGGTTGVYSNNCNNTTVVRSAAGTLYNISGTYSIRVGDTLFLYDGMGTTAPLLASYSGNGTIGPMASTSNVVTVVFKSNNSNVADGFELSLRCFSIPTCYIPVDLTVIPLFDSCILLWRELGASTSWEVEYGPCGFTPGTGTVVTVFDTTYTIAGLASGTCYDCYVWGICPNGGYSDTAFASFSTLNSKPVYSLPYRCTFADTAIANAWEFLNTGQPSQWYVGSAAYRVGTDIIGLYISNNSGISNTYLNAGTAHAFAFRTFYLTPGNYIYSYEWRSMGDTLHDYLRAAMVSCNVPLTAGNASGFSPMSVPTQAIALDGGRWLALSPQWSASNGNFTIRTTGVYKLVFYWANDYIGYCDQPAAVDNVVLMDNSCPPVTSFRISSIGPRSATVTWTPGGSESQWQVDFNGRSRVVQSPTATFTGLTPDTTYECRVMPICGAGDTGMTALVSFTTQSVRCDMPQGLGHTSLMDTSVVLSWIGFDTFELSYKLASSTVWDSTLIVVDSSCFLTGLRPNTRYQWGVRRRCSPLDYSLMAVSEFTTMRQSGGGNGSIAEAGNMQLSIYPNPAEADDGVTVEVRGVEGTVTVAVVDIAGRILRQEELTCGGDCMAHVEFADLPRGAYFVKVQTTERTAIEKVVIR
ncbi:MAG: T9SS type A sorting domain-containing protein [Bacteroidales bacterium]|nr:T9SS type A sorting domain-containing protein [Bacteroidales bacterium]